MPRVPLLSSLSSLASLASLFALALPGPCATFDGVETPAVSDAATGDAPGPVDDAAGGALCDAGVRFAFVNDAGCQEEVDRSCCIFETECTRDEACLKWVACVNACPPPRGGGCVGKCGEVRDASFGNALTGLSSCRAAFDGGGSCAWP